MSYKGWSVDLSQDISKQLSDLTGDRFVVKVDEGIKGRFKKGLVILDVAGHNVPQALKTLERKGYRQFIVEPVVRYEPSAERYISLLSDREGVLLQYTAQGGIHVEQHADKVKRLRIKQDIDWDGIAHDTGFTIAQLQNLVDAFKSNYFAFLEINPYVVLDDQLYLLDAAVEVDDAAEFFVNSWSADDFRRHRNQKITTQELTVQELDANSPASLKLSVLQPNGSIFLLLSGGGASVVVADEVYNQGLGKQLANYGEYSGNPNTEETYLYTKAVLELVLASKAHKKVIFIGGAVANFTDIAKTFAGIIQAINEVGAKLRRQKVKIYVRRGGPNQEVGLARLEAALAKQGVLGAVHDPSTPLTIAVNEALQEVKRV